MRHNPDGFLRIIARYSGDEIGTDTRRRPAVRSVYLYKVGKIHVNKTLGNELSSIKFSIPAIIRRHGGDGSKVDLQFDHGIFIGIDPLNNSLERCHVTHS